MCTYLRGRTTSWSYNRRESAKIVLHQGVSQGSILSPQLLNLYVSTYPETAHLCISYADDFTAIASSQEVDRAVTVLASHAADQKSTFNLFTPQTQQAQFHQTVLLNGPPLLLDLEPKILGVTFEPLFHFHKHVDNIVKKAKPRVNILRLLYGSSWANKRKRYRLLSDL